jgi:hypothetical protein
MKTRIVILVIALAAMFVNIGTAQAVYDRAGNQYNCRVPGGNIYTKESPTMHNYDIAAAKTAGERHPANHDAMCIDPLTLHKIKWFWTGANHIKVNFYPMTNDSTTGNVCWTSTDPFTGTPPHSGNSNILQSGVANNNYQWCAYKIQFDSSLGSYDPHIIITGDRGILLEALQKRVQFLNVVLEKKGK